MCPKGRVVLVGAGPGDPGLLTMKGFECLQKADIIFYDYLANKDLFRWAKASSVKVYVGKKGASHAREQDQINQLLIQEAQKGKVVVRLKGGDPFVFGRGGEEAEALAQAKIPYEIIPGITSAIAVPAYAGIPVTHRDFTSVVAFVTGHEKDENGHMPIDWSALARIGTVVFLMGSANLEKIVSHLLQEGRDQKTPVAVIHWGTLPLQKTVIGTLATIVEEVEKSQIRPPTIIVVGDVVNLREKLNWFESKPLFGKRILVTRAREQSSELAKRLQFLGASVVEMPTIEIKPPVSWKKLDSAILKIFKYSWLIFTSANGVKFFFERLVKNKKDARSLAHLKIAVIGSATAESLENYGLKADIVAKNAIAEGLIAALKKQNLKGQRILFPRAKEGRELLLEFFKKKGAKVDLLEAYRTMMPVGAPLGAPESGMQQAASLRQEIDLITFASSSTVENFMKIVGANLVFGQKNQIHELSLQKIPVACIGPITAATAKKHGLNVVIQPKKHSIPDLVHAIENYFLSGLI